MKVPESSKTKGEVEMVVMETSEGALSNNDLKSRVGSKTEDSSSVELRTYSTEEKADNVEDDTCNEKDGSRTTGVLQQPENDTEVSQTANDNDDDDDHDNDTDGLPIDRGWAWVILGANIFQIFIYAGTMKSFGVFFIKFMERFNATASQVSLIFTIQNILISATSLFILTIVIEKIGSRWSVFIGTLMTSCSYLISGYATRFEILYFSLGVMGGLGIPMAYFPFVTALPQYFKKHRGLANSITSSGASLGGLVFAPIITTIFEEYGYSGALLITAGLFLNMQVAGTLLRPIESFKKKNLEDTPKEIKSTDATERGKGFSLGLSGDRLSTTSLDGAKKARQIDTCTEGQPVTNFEEMKPFLPPFRSKSLEAIKRRRTTSESSTGSGANLNGVLGYLSRSKTALYTSCDLIHGSMIDVRRNKDEEEICEEDSSNKFTVACCCWKVANFCGSVIDCSLLKNPVMLAYLVMASVVLPGVALVPVYIAPYAKDNGVPTKKIGLMYTVIGSIDLFAKLAAGFIMDKKMVKNTTFLAGALIVIGIGCHLIRFFTTFESLMVMVVLIGLCGGMYMATYAAILADYIGVDKFKNALGLVALVHGVAVAAIFPFVGLLRDVTETYVVPFHALGVLVFIGASVAVSLPRIRSWWQKKQAAKTLKQENI